MNANDEKLKLMRDEKIPKVLLKMGIPGLGMTFGSGAASYISRLLGEGNANKANETASTALIASLSVGTAAILLSLCFLDPILIALGATETILPYARAFALIFISGSILNIFTITMNNIITAEGKAKLTMMAMLISGGLNVILNPIFIYPLGFGIRGSAISTVVAQGATAVFYLRYIRSKKGFLRFSFRYFRFEGRIFTEIFKVGVPILVFQILSSAAMGLSNTAASDYGDSAVAAVGVVTRIMTLGTYVVFIPAILIMPRLFGIEGIIWAQPAADFLTVVLTAALTSGLHKKSGGCRKKSLR